VIGGSHNTVEANYAFKEKLPNLKDMKKIPHYHRNSQ
jgi:hypothetical protein